MIVPLSSLPFGTARCYDYPLEELNWDKPEPYMVFYKFLLFGITFQQ